MNNKIVSIYESLLAQGIEKNQAMATAISLASSSIILPAVDKAPPSCKKKYPQIAINPRAGTVYDRVMAFANQNAGKDWLIADCAATICVERPYVSTIVKTLIERGKLQRVGIGIYRSTGEESRPLPPFVSKKKYYHFRAVDSDPGSGTVAGRIVEYAQQNIKKCWLISDCAASLGINPSYTNVIAKQLIKQGKLRRIRLGVYRGVVKEEGK